MERTMKLLVFLGLLYSVVAQGTTTVPGSAIVTASPVVSVPGSAIVTASPVVSVTTTVSGSVIVTASPVVTTSHVVHPTPTPTGTPSPPTPKPTTEEYVVRNESGEACLRMSMSLEVNTTYNTTDGKEMFVSVPVVDASEDPTSFCDHNLVSLLLTWAENSTTNSLNFTFHRNSTSWVADKVNYTFGITEDSYPDFPTDVDGTFNFTFDTALFRQDDTNRNFNQSYLCNASRPLMRDGTNFTSTLYVKNLRVQAFEFKNSTSGLFDSAYNCNNRGNKIVPIAVGAALAGLVIVVLIAYLIGRLKRRNTGSYEALS